MVWIHGGAFSERRGFAALVFRRALCHATAMSSWCSINYRLGALGFLVLCRA